MMQAYYGVRFYRKNLQGKCDSLSYSMTDSTIRMYDKPVIWSGKNQLTADSIAIAVSGNRADSLMMYNTSFIVSKDSIETFNQIRGKIWLLILLIMNYQNKCEWKCPNGLLRT